jgi:hypothetical protein
MGVETRHSAHFPGRVVHGLRGVAHTQGGVYASFLMLGLSQWPHAPILGNDPSKTVFLGEAEQTR